MVWFATAEEKFMESEQEPLRIKPITINISNTLNASNAGSFITCSLKFPKLGDASWRRSSAGRQGMPIGGEDEGEGR